MFSIKITTNLILLAFKNLWRRKARTTLTVMAVTIGTTAVITLVSIATGAEAVFMNQMEQTGALTQVTVIASDIVESVDIFSGGIGEVDGENITDDDIAVIRTLDHVVDVSPTLRIYPLQSINVPGSDKHYQIDVMAIVPNQAIEMAAVAGRGLEVTDTHGIFLAHKTAQILSGAENGNNFEHLIGQTVTFSLEKSHFTASMELPDDEIIEFMTLREELYRQNRNKEADDIPNPIDEIINTVEGEIVGVGLPGPNEWQSFIVMDWGKDLLTRKTPGGPVFDDFDQPNQGQSTGEYETMVWDDFEERGYNTLIAKVDDLENVELVASQIKSRTNRGAITAKDFLESFLRIFLIIQIALGSIGGIALLVASIGIINTMLMSILERTREIGLLKSLGATGGMVGLIFAFEAGLIGLLGGLTGIGLGIGISEIVNRVASTQLSAQNFTIEDIITFPTWLIIGSLAFSFILGLAAGLYPALRAARLDPIDALRAE